MLVNVDGKEVARPCTCKKEDSLNNLFINTNIPPRFYKKDLKAFLIEKGNKDQSNAKKKAENFVKDYPAVGDYGLFFQGSTGVGKTLLLCAIGNELSLKSFDVYYIDWNDLNREMRSGEDTSNRDFQNIGQLIHRLATVQLLLFDELGASRPSPWALDNIYYLINRRYNENKITLFATNYFDERIGIQETLTDRIGERIRSRIYEMTNTIKLSGKDRRNLKE